MNKEWLLKVIKDAHDNAVDKGFYPVDEGKNIGELLMLCVSELGEALEAHRCDRYADIKSLNICTINIENINHEWIGLFQRDIKDTVEDELGDVFIRLADLCGYLVERENHDIVVQNFLNTKRLIPTDINVGEWMFHYIRFFLSDIDFYEDKNYIPAGSIGRALAELSSFAASQKIDIAKFVEAKMAYNRTRPPKHGKRY
ncbi:MAG: hypothetical protein PQJ59_16755 [Spirochaetales bacterium]|nr:hypothetical protein [Spirochaetales bacterium]